VEPKEVEHRGEIEWAKIGELGKQKDMGGKKKKKCSGGGACGNTEPGQECNFGSIQGTTVCGERFVLRKHGFAK